MATALTKDLSTFKIFLDGEVLPGTLQVVSVVTERSINKVPLARIILKDGDPSAQDFPASNSKFFEPGTPVKIEAGFHNSNETIFEGIVIKQSIKLKNGRDSFLVVECKDKAYKMTLSRKNKYFIDKGDSEAVEEIIKAYSIKGNVDATSVKHRQLVQYNATDWDFIVSRTELNGFIMYMENGVMNCKKPTVASNADVSVSFGSDVISFDAQLDASNQYETVTCSSWDMSTQDIARSDNQRLTIQEAGNLSSAALAGKINEKTMQYTHSGKLNTDELKSWATARQTKNILSKSRGIITCKGKFEAKPAGTVGISGFGNRYNGNHFISGVRHELKESLWETTIQFGWWPELFSEQFNMNNAPASGILPAVQGLQIGVVTKLEGDPEKEFRVQVKFPLMDNKSEGIWARIALLDAGKERGSFFMPDLKDEVIVGFINDDPRDAIVLGMLNSSKNPPPIQPSDKNDEKGFVTRSKMKLTFHDKKQIILLHTPAGKEITLDEDQKKIILKDEFKNRIEMSKDGIVIESCKDIKLKAKKDINAEGVNVAMKGSGNFKAEGNGGAKLSSAGTTDVKGSIININ
jgi:Rhs element Vgr protein